MIKTKNIELFKNLSQYDLENQYYDFHNDYDCIKISFENCFLTFLFKHINEGFIISMKFKNVILEKFEFTNFSELKNLTIDNLYRGRFEKNDELFEFYNDDKSYFYLEFYKGGKFEFWCDEISIDKH